jgi:uncharacterized protein (DUF433 family)
VATSEHPYVTESAGIGGGYPGGYPQVRVIRIPVRYIVLTYRHFQDFKRAAEAYPPLSLEQVRGALDYYAVYPERVDEDIETNERAYENSSRTAADGGLGVRLCTDEMIRAIRPSGCQAPGRSERSASLVALWSKPPAEFRGLTVAGCGEVLATGAPAQVGRRAGRG